jgi:phosphate/sulfate permease
MEAFIRNKYEKKKFIAKVSYVLHELVGVPFSSMDVFASSIFGTGSLYCMLSVLSCLAFHLFAVLLIRISQGFAVKFSPDPDLGF